MDRILGILITLFGFSTQLLAGAVSGGGGGTTNPIPAMPADVEQAIADFASPSILMFLNKQEYEFEQQTEENKLTSPYYKLFRPTNGVTVFDHVKNLSVEIHRNSACLDANGESKDGSVYASKPGAVCISSFSIAPKVNARNVAAETVALILHELSHLSGATETEATEIQNEFVELNLSQLLDAKTRLKMAALPLMGRFGEPLLSLKYWINVPSAITTPELDQWATELMNIHSNQLRLASNELFALRYAQLSRMAPIVRKILVIRDYISTQDPREDSEVRANDSKQLALGFGGDRQVTLMTYLTRIGYFSLAAEYETISIHKMDTLADVTTNLSEIQNYLWEVSTELKATDAFRINYYLN